MEKRRDINFTEGNIVRAILLFALPIIGGELLQNLYNSVDTLVVGNFVGATALAAIGVSATLTQLLVGFFNGMSVGSTVVVSKAFGRGNEDEIRRNIRYTFTFSCFLGLIISILAILFAAVLLHVTGANEEVFAEALLYFRIYLLGLTFTVVYNSGAGILRALGDSRSPFLILMITSILNIGLDLLFTGALGWELVGVAVATVISQFVSALLIYRRISGRIGGSCIAVSETFRHGWVTIREAMGIGFWAGMQSALICFSNLFVWRYINGFATLEVAGISVGVRIDKFVNLPLKAYGMAMTTYIGQNRGAKNQARIKKGIVSCTLLSLASWLFFGTVIYLFCPAIVKLFNSEPVVISTAESFLKTIVPFYCFMSIREVLLGVLRGFGKSTVPMLVTVIGMVGIRQLFLALAMQQNHSIVNVYYGYPVGWFSAMFLLLVYALAVRKKLKV